MLKLIKPPLYTTLRIIRIPNCEKCKHSLKENGVLVCKYFKYTPVTLIENKYYYYMNTDYCRNMPDLCGEEGKYFKPK
jgi:hypothetical protein